MNRYSYDELRRAATAPDATQTDIDALGEWFSEYGAAYWNGEYYDADGLELWPVMEWDEDLDQGDIVGYELR